MHALQRTGTPGRILPTMDETGDNEIVPRSGDRERGLQPRARDAVRDWIAAAAGEADMLARIDRIGGEALRGAADLSLRLADGAAPRGSGRALLDRLEAVAAQAAPPAKASFWRRTPDPAALPRQIEQLAAELAGEYDATLKAAMRLESDLARFETADAGLEEIVHLLRALRRQGEAAARELRFSDAGRAAALAGAVARIDAREADVLTQLVIVRQGRMTLELSLANQRTLAAALDRARHSAVAALATASAAGRAVRERDVLAREADALARSAQAIDGETRRGAATKAALDMALVEVKAALAAARDVG